jgi:hypothetical protein
MASLAQGAVGSSSSAPVEFDMFAATPDAAAEAGGTSVQAHPDVMGLPAVGGECSMYIRCGPKGAKRGQKLKVAVHVIGYDANGETVNIVAFGKDVDKLLKMCVEGQAYVITHLRVREVVAKWQETNVDKELSFTSASTIEHVRDSVLPIHPRIEQFPISGFASAAQSTRVSFIARIIMPSAASLVALRKYVNNNVLPRDLVIFVGDASNFVAKVVFSEYSGKDSLQRICNIFRSHIAYNKAHPTAPKAADVLYFNSARIHQYNSYPTVYMKPLTGFYVLNESETEMYAHKWSELKATFNVAGGDVPARVRGLCSQA